MRGLAPRFEIAQANHSAYRSCDAEEADDDDAGTVYKAREGLPYSRRWERRLCSRLKIKSQYVRLTPLRNYDVLIKISVPFRPSNLSWFRS